MNKAIDKKLIILTGPTAVGKSELAVKLAKEISGEIISADSMQVYRHMDIGSAKILPEEMAGVPHHLINVLDPIDEFNVVVFQKMAKNAMEKIWQKGHVPILTGGTGFYIQAVLYDIDVTHNDEDSHFRRQLEQLAKDKGNETLYERLKQIDPESCESIHPNNVKRVIRAIEFYEKTGKKISQHNREQQENLSPYRFAYFVLNDERAKLYDRIDKVPHLFVRSMENVCAVFMYVYSFDVFTIYVASQMVALVDNKTSLALFCQFVSHHGSVESGTNNKIVVFSFFHVAYCLMRFSSESSYLSLVKNMRLIPFSWTFAL